MAWKPTTYDSISRNHTNWSSLNLSENVSQEQTNSYWERQLLRLDLQGQTQKNLNGGWHPPPPNHPPPPHPPHPVQRVNIPETNSSYFDVARLLNLIVQYNGQHNEMGDWKFKQYNLSSLLNTQQI